MSDEYFDLVDENNQPTGEKKQRSDAHRDGSWHRTVHVYFYRQAGGDFELLVHLRSKDKDLEPNKWDTRFGGHLKAGETLDEAVFNETREELGHDIKQSNLDKGDTVKKENFPNNEFSTEYFYKYDGDLSEFIFSDNEVQEVKWMSVKEIKIEMKTKPEIWTSSSETMERISKNLHQRI